MDSTFGQIALPLAVAAGSAYSPYVQRGIGPALGTLGAIGNWNENKARTAAIQAQADQAQQESAGRQAFATNIGHAVDAATPMPQGQTLGQALGPNSGVIEPSDADVAAGQQLTVPRGSLSLSPSEAATIKGEAQIPSMQGTASAALQAAQARARLPTADEALAGMPKPKPGVTYRQPIQGGGQVDVAMPEPKTAEAAYISGDDIPDNVPPDMRANLIAGREHEIISKKYQDKAAALAEQNEGDWRADQAAKGLPHGHLDYVKAQSIAGAAGAIAAANANPARSELPAGVAEAAVNYAKGLATKDEIDEAGSPTGKKTIDPAVYEKAFNDYVARFAPGRTGAATPPLGSGAPPPAGGVPQYTTADGKYGSYTGKKGTWFPIKGKGTQKATAPGRQPTTSSPATE